MSDGAQVEWRWLRRWTGAELSHRLGRAENLLLNFEAAWEEMTLANGWNQVESQAVIARAPPGAPRDGGAFEHAREAVLAFAFSDTRIVEGHFRPDAALGERRVLLELKSLGLSFLCPVRVGAVRDERGEEESAFGYRYDTLQGHIEVGREWFLVTQEHRTGLVRFRIQAAWRPGQFPNGWSRLGFHLLGRHYQRAWHHLAHVRLRELLREGRLPAAPDAHAHVHGAHAREWHPIVIYAQRAGGRRLSGVEQEVERVRWDGLMSTVWLGILAGMRSMSAPALLSLRLARDPEPPVHPLTRLLSAPRAARVLGVLAAGELVADKLPWMPARVAPVALTGRALSGALVGATVAARGRRALAGFALAGAVTAVATAFTLFKLRRRAGLRLRVPDAYLGLLEDAAAAALSARLLAVLR